MPSGNIDVPIIEDNFDGTIRVQYNPKEDGVHELILLHDGAPVQGTVFYFAFFSLNFLDILSRFESREIIRRFKPKVIINFSARIKSL